MTPSSCVVYHMLIRILVQPAAAALHTVLLETQNQRVVLWFVLLFIIVVFVHDVTGAWVTTSLYCPLYLAFPERTFGVSVVVALCACDLCVLCACVCVCVCGGRIEKKKDSFPV